MSYWFLYNATSGVIKDNTVSPYHGSTTEWTNIPNGYGVVGPIADTDTTAQDAFVKPDEYTVQNSQLVHSNAPTAVQQLSDAKTAKLIYLAQCRDNAIFSTFTSSCTGTLYTYTADDRARLRYERCARKAATDTTYTGDSIYTHEVGFVAHTGAQLIQLCEDGAAHEKNQWTHYDTKVSDVDNATTVDAVNAVTW